MSEENRNNQDNPVQSGKQPWWKHLLNFHVLFVVLIIAIITIIVARFNNWGVRVDVDEFFQNHELITGDEDTFDVFFPLMDEQGELLANKSPHTILFFGNSPLADDRESENNVVNMIARRTGATVYNCSVADSYLTASNYSLYGNESGIDSYNFYFLTIALAEKLDVFSWLETNPKANILPETEEVRGIIETIDMDTVDTIAIMYDGSDYLAGNSFYNPEGRTDPITFAGNLEAGIEVLQKAYPHVRIIVMSPTYAFGVGDDGEYISSDIKTYGDGTILSSYALRECESAVSHNVTFVDHIYGTFNEDEASEYLTDNIHLNQAGREKVVQRFIQALTKFDEN